MTSPPPGTHRRRRAGVVGLIAAAVLTVAPLVVPAASADSATPTPSPSTASGTVEFTFTPVSGGIVEQGDALTVSLTIENGTDAVVPRTQVDLSLGATPFADRAALTRWLAGTTAGVVTAAVEQATIPAVGPGDVSGTGVGVDADDPALDDLAPGVYPLLAEYELEGRSASSTSVIVVPDDEVSADVAIVVPIVAPTTTAGLLTSDQLAELTAEGGSLDAQLGAVTGTLSILAIDPAIPASIRVLGDAAPASAIEWLERLEALSNPRFALQFGDADAGVQVASGRDSLAEPISLQAYMSAGDFATGAEATPSPTPSATTDPSAPDYPTLDELLDLGAETDTAIVWPAADTTPGAVAALGAMDAVTMVSSAATSTGAGGATVPARADAGDAALLVYDDDASRALLAASSDDTSATRNAALTAVTAQLTMAAADADGAPLLVSLGRATDRSRVALGATISAITRTPGIDAVGLDSVLAASPVDVELADAVTSEDPAQAASLLFDDEQRLTEFATVLDDPTLLTGPERAEILQLLAVSWTRDDTWSEAVAAHREQNAATRDSVGIVEPTSIQLLSQGASLPVWVRNDLPYPVNVVLHAEPDDVRLEVAPTTEVDAAKSSNTAVKVPVQARVGSGDVSVDLWLLSPTGVRIGGVEQADVTVRADWERIGIVILGVVVGGLLVIGVVRTLRRRRADRDAAASADESVDE
ncbi:DUF6049 family protein [Microbacterium fluvii]|uniref:DUF6049 family protein n=1 Tax=Microbacterium fluvii TaxID=415215 RepID=A0ABW2HK66_9MICO|nr:DUF6049 family protein [Microbacterium fluvii]MCU4673692.1 DUF6049 family protein [Microbacterium fluvii]